MSARPHAEPESAGPSSDTRPVLFFLHFLGGSARSWDRVVDRLSPVVRCIAIDLPGFGDAADQPGRSVAAMTDHVAGLIIETGAPRWVLAGHSMGAKVAAAVARRAEDGAKGLDGLSHLVLLAGSPPAPEPMDDERRIAMKAWFDGDPAQSRREAQAFIDANVGAPLDAAGNDGAVADVLRANRDAWVAWLDGGSKEDWSDRIGTLRTPTLILAGEKDGDLGPEAQARLMVPHFANVALQSLSEARHLLPLERDADVARLILAHLGLSGPASLDPAFTALIESDRVSARTRSVLLDRAAPDPADADPKAMPVEAFATLRAVTRRVVPQNGPEPIDLAARIDAALVAGPGDGWRFATLPADPEAYRRALATLEAGARAAFGQGFSALDGAVQDAILATVQAGTFGETVPADGDRLDADGMRAWFEDLRGAAVSTFVSHPATYARMGYGGFAYGGDGDRLQGFSKVGIGEIESWEPETRTERIP